MKTNNTSTTNLMEFTNRMKQTDSRYAQIVKNLQLIYYIIIPIYAILIVIDIYRKEPLLQTIGACCMLLSLSVLAFVLRNIYKEYNHVDYAQPTLIMLKNAAKRYRPFQGKTLWALLALVVMGAGLTFRNLEFNPLGIIIPYALLIAIAIIAGLIWWYIRYKPIRDGALELIKEIENGWKEK